MANIFKLICKSRRRNQFCDEVKFSIFIRFENSSRTFIRCKISFYLDSSINFCVVVNRNTQIDFCVTRLDGGNPRDLIVPNSNIFETHLKCGVTTAKPPSDDGVSFYEEKCLMLPLYSVCLLLCLT